jgi:hypothetical protein
MRFAICEARFVRLLVASRDLGMAGGSTCEKCKVRMRTASNCGRRRDKGWYLSTFVVQKSEDVTPREMRLCGIIPRHVLGAHHRGSCRVGGGAASAGSNVILRDRSTNQARLLAVYITARITVCVASWWGMANCS